MRDGLLAFLGVSACVSAAAAGCSYDWTPAGAASDGGGLDAADAGIIDAARDATADIAPSAEAAMDAPTAMDAADVVEAATLPACTASQEMTVAQDRAAALVCTGVTPSPCQTKVTDECGCPVYVATNNQAEATYVSAVKQLQMTCIPSCPGCGTAPSPGVCIISDAGGGALSCYQ
ncbi:MAG: hypothetical protein ABSE49_14500 [Polyangiaceae bacterium]